MDLARYCVDAVLVEGRSVRAVATATGRSKSWVHRHVALFRAGGEAALAPLRRGPKVPANLTSAVLEDEIVAWRKRLAGDGLDAGARTIHWHLRQSGAPVPALSTIHRVLRRRGAITPQPQKRPRSSWTRFESALPNETWQTDMTHWHLDNERPVEIINFIDDYSRAVLASVAVPVATAPDVVRIFFATTAIYGFPASVLSDNGAIYTAAYRGSHSGMEIELAALGITFKHGKPYHPQTQGKVERYHLTLKKWLRKRPSAATIVELQAQIDRFVHIYNGTPAHRSGLSAHARLARARQGHRRTGRPASAGPHQGPSRPDRQDRLRHLALSVQAPPHRRRQGAHGHARAHLDGWTRRPGDRPRRGVDPPPRTGPLDRLPRAGQNYYLRVHVSQKI
jgi:transposase InsO family protein